MLIIYGVPIGCGVINIGMDIQAASLVDSSIEWIAPFSRGLRSSCFVSPHLQWQALIHLRVGARACDYCQKRESKNIDYKSQNYVCV